MKTLSSKWHKCSGISQISNIGYVDYHHGTMSEIGSTQTPSHSVGTSSTDMHGFIGHVGDDVKYEYNHISLIGQRNHDGVYEFAYADGNAWVGGIW